ncbi:MAG TPA: hypothetical protein VMR21_16580 [Vicinamibacteria bacterium]|nr:hypothetical protein [Vicinamibacteria bacterium]
MRKRPATTLVLVALASSLSAAETLTIEHPPVGCVVAGKYPQLQARFTPAPALAKARVLFQPPGTTHWYAVTMSAEGSGFLGVLPRPSKDLERFRYYIEGTDTSAGTARTADHTARVVGSAMECEGQMVAGTLGSATVALQVPAGAPAIPAGFASSGVTVAAAGAVAGVAAGTAATGGGVSTALVIGAVGAAGGAVVIAKNAGSGGSERTYSGSFNGEYTSTNVCPRPAGGTSSCERVFTVSGNATVTLVEESGGTVRDASGLQLTGTLAEIRTQCIPGGSNPFSRTCTLSGPPSALACRAEQTGGDGSRTDVFEFAGALGGGALTGNVTLTESGRSQIPSGTCTSTASGRFPLTLR